MIKRISLKLLLVSLIFTASIILAQETPYVYTDHNKRDPFWRLVGPDGTILNYEMDLVISDMILEGVIYDPNGKSLAIINGKVVSRNGKIGLFMVSEIYEDKVILYKGSERYILQIKKEE